MSEEAAPKQWWVSAIEKLGVPTVYLVILTFAFWRVAVYVATEVIAPVVTAHVEALHAHIEVAKALSETIDDARENARASLLRIEKSTEEALKNSEEVLQILKDKP